MPNYRYVQFDGFLYRQVLPITPEHQRAMETWRADTATWVPAELDASLEAAWFGVERVPSELRQAHPEIPDLPAESGSLAQELHTLAAAIESNARAPQPLPDIHIHVDSATPTKKTRRIERDGNGKPLRIIEE